MHRITGLRATIVTTVLIASGVPAAIARAGDAPDAPVPQCGPIVDDFARADSSDLGANWSELDQDYAITDDSLGQSTSTAGKVLFNNVTATDICTDLYRPNSQSAVDFGGLLLNYGGPKNFVLVKAQRNANAKFNRIFVYQGNKDTPIASEGFGAFPFPSNLRLHAYLTQDPDGTHRVNVGADVDFDGEDNLTFSVVYDPAGANGNRIGVTSSGGVLLDDFRVTNPVSLGGGPGVTPIGTGGTGGTGGSKDTTKPRLGRFGLSRTVFAAARSGASTAAKRRRTPVGTTVSYTVSEASTIRFGVQKALSGRRSGSRCAKPTRRNRGKKRCTRWRTMRGSFTQTARNGRNSFVFRGRLRGRALHTGRYRLVGRATDRSKLRSELRTATFRIAR